MLVELDVFSGRQNPAWRLDEPAARELRRRLAALSPSNARAVDPPGLGYRGFSCTDTTETWRAFKGVVSGPKTTLADPGMTVERFLLEHLPAEFAGLRQRIARELM